MSGRLEKENKLRIRIENKLEELPPVFTEFYNYMEADQKSYATIEHYIEYTRDFMNFMSDKGIYDDFYKDITVAEIREYITSLRRREKGGKEIRNGSSIQATRWSALNTFFNFLVLDDYIDINPMTKTKRPKNRVDNEIVYLEQDEIEIILDKIKNESKVQYKNRDIAVITLSLVTGVRVGALVQIDIEDIDFKENTIRVIEKGDKERYLKFGTNTRDILSAWLLDRTTYFGDTDTHALFVSQRRQRLTVEGVRRIIGKYADGINGKHITPHKLRSSTATNMAKAGVDIQTIANILGHNSVTTTQRYAAVLDSNKQKAVNAIDGMF